jgi:diphthamide biosynthesis protein 2
MHSNSEVVSRFNLTDVVSLITKFGYKKVVLQFPDEELTYSVAVYDYLADALSEEADIYITADSTWGSSIDDVSAMHCDADLLVYFGTDLSSSGSIPVAVCPSTGPLSADHCQLQILSAINSVSDRNGGARIALFYEAGYHRSLFEVAAGLRTAGSNEVYVAQLPPHADLTAWVPYVGRRVAEGGTDNGQVVVGGLLIPSDVVEDPSTVVVYVGDKGEQIVNIMLRASQNTVLHYSPAEAGAPSTGSAVRVLKGTDSKEFRERYGGVLRVKDAKIVGIIVGSMGLTADLTKDIVHRLQVLIRAAHKRYYTFVMGRLNEAKLCNFPEVPNELITGRHHDII